MLKWLLGFANVLGLTLILLFIAIYIPTFTLSYYERYYKNHNTSEQLQISEEDLTLVTSKLLGYMKGQHDDLYILVTIDGHEREFFNEREIYHMEDVKKLFDIGYIIRDVAILIFIITLFYALIIKKDAIHIFNKCYLIGFSTILISVISLVFLIFTNFDRYFIIFHEIFFFNDLWILNPETDLLINLVPLEFFINIFRTVSTIFLVSIVILIVGSSLFLYFKRQKL